MEASSSRPAKNPRRARLAFSRRDLNSNSKEIAGVEPDPLDPADDEDGGSAGDGYDGVPEVGMIFKTHQEVSRFYKRYARRVGFGVSVRRSSFTKEGHCLYLELMCCKGGRKRPEPKFRKRTTATTNCQARIRVKLWGDAMLHLELANLDHNHPVSPSMARFLNCYKQLTVGVGFPKKRGARHNGNGIATTATDDDHGDDEPASVTRLGALEELLFGESECRSFVERGRLRLGEGDPEALRLFFTRMQAKNSNFFNVVDLDEAGCVRNAFWSDARSRAAYEYYNDVVMLNTSYVVGRVDLIHKRLGMDRCYHGSTSKCTRLLSNQRNLQAQVLHSQVEKGRCLIVGKLGRQPKSLRSLLALVLVSWLRLKGSSVKIEN